MLGLAFVAVAARLVDLQVVGGDRYEQMALGQRVRTITLSAERGVILDRNGRELAVSIPQTTIWANPQVVSDPGWYAAQLKFVLGERVDEASVATRLGQTDKQFVYVARQVDDDAAARVRALALPGVSTVEESKRTYPAGSLASPLIGWVGLDGNGLGGLESQYDSLLQGTPGKAVLERDPTGREIPAGPRQMQPAQRGGDLVLTIDQAVQYEAERLLTERVAAIGAKGGTAVVVEIKTGEILAMATVDGATAGKPAGAVSGSAGKNRALTDVYEPGSTSKLITMAGAIEDGVVGPDTRFDVPWALPVGDTIIRDAEQHTNEWWSVQDIFTHSSNVGTVKVAQQLGSSQSAIKQRLEHWLRAFGLGVSTGVSFPGESAGIVDSKTWGSSSVGNVPIGYGAAVTPLQMLEAFVTIANGGVSKPPRLVDATIDADGRRTDVESKSGQQVVSPATAATMMRLLENVVASGTGTKAAVPGYRVAGKTGTAKKAPYDACTDEHPELCRYVASFAGVAPAEDPAVATIVLIDEPPAGSIFGGEVAAPVFAGITKYALRALKIPATAAVDTAGVTVPRPTTAAPAPTPATPARAAEPVSTGAGVRAAGTLAAAASPSGEDGRAASRAPG